LRRGSSFFFGLYNLKIGERYPTECPLPLGMIITSDNTNETSLTNRRVCLGVLYFEFVAVIQIRDGKIQVYQEQ
jgi:hypothetical protein